ncbi:DNA polymerase III subunit delta [Bosea sp. (in: a-proteobacteria)]|uniref:DNA polymerase III subunit delta n=1 Tax=Bosea sp. (in: a-proteobacteria) TaxID=1871050 RepID=UPI00263222AB|nr:DNA polymerase III subunit delta [Bosea sp. (in: a-proteobacteria)]MCO5090514.1 DNA polymerase III subunit delta [Bosea sp. (in: a-proteobacteria)]
MVAIKAHEAERSLARLDPAWRLVLIYGPDAGLVSERAAGLARASVDDPQDGFQLVRMDGDAVAADPLKLADEANTIGLFGGRRAIRVSPTTKPLLAAVEPLLATPSQDALVIVEAGDLQRSNPLRTACEKAKTALAVPCYGDAARDLGTIIDEMVRGAGKSIDRATRDHLAGLLGGDRQTSRREIEKLMLYVGAEPAVLTEHVEAIVGDTAQREQAMLVDAVFAGKLAVLDLAQAKLMSEGLDPGVMLGAVLRQALALLKARQSVDAGRGVKDVVATMRLPYPRIATTEAALVAWSSPKLTEAVTLIGNAVLATRQDSEMGRAIATRALWTLARLGRAGRSE